MAGKGKVSVGIRKGFIKQFSLRIQAGFKRHKSRRKGPCPVEVTMAGGLCGIRSQG
jgi:hypothetical protein